MIDSPSHWFLWLAESWHPVPEFIYARYKAQGHRVMVVDTSIPLSGKRWPQPPGYTSWEHYANSRSSGKPPMQDRRS